MRMISFMYVVLMQRTVYENGIVHVCRVDVTYHI